MNNKIEELQNSLYGIRLLYNISVKELAEEIGCSRQQIRNIETHKYDLSKTSYLAIKSVLPKLIKKHKYDKRNIEECVDIAKKYLKEKTDE